MSAVRIGADQLLHAGDATIRVRAWDVPGQPRLITATVADEETIQGYDVYAIAAALERLHGAADLGVPPGQVLP